MGSIGACCCASQHQRTGFVSITVGRKLSSAAATASAGSFMRPNATPAFVLRLGSSRVTRAGRMLRGRTLATADLAGSTLPRLVASVGQPAEAPHAAASLSSACTGTGVAGANSACSRSRSMLAVLAVGMLLAGMVPLPSTLFTLAASLTVAAVPFPSPSAATRPASAGPVA